MASISNRPNGQRRLLFVDPAGKRKTIYLGKMPKRHADAIKIKVEQLVAAVVSGCPWDNETARWVAELPDTLASKLGVNTTFSLEVIPPKGAVLFIERTTPVYLDSVISLD